MIVVRSTTALFSAHTVPRKCPEQLFIIIKACSINLKLVRFSYSAANCVASQELLQISLLLVVAMRFGDLMKSLTLNLVNVVLSLLMNLMQKRFKFVVPLLHSCWHDNINCICPIMHTWRLSLKSQFKVIVKKVFTCCLSTSSTYCIASSFWWPSDERSSNGHKVCILPL